MDKKTIGDWIMYHEVHRLLREGVSYSAIASLFVMNRRTVVKYAGMTEAEYEAFLIKKDTRTKLLDVYEAFVRDRLMAHPAASAAQMHDWLKERTDIAYDDQLTRPVIITNFDHLSGPGPSADIDGGLVIAVLAGQMCGEVLSTPWATCLFCFLLVRPVDVWTDASSTGSTTGTVETSDGAAAAKSSPSESWVAAGSIGTSGIYRSDRRP